MSGGKIIPVIAAGDREALAKIDAASDKLHAEYVRGFVDLRDRIATVRSEIYTTIAELSVHAAELRKRVEMLERKNREGVGTPAKP